MDEHSMSRRSRGKAVLSDKAALRRILEAQDKESGFSVDPEASPQKARSLMLAQGIRPEDNAFSCEIRRMREGN